MLCKGGDIITSWGKYTIRHDQQHIKDRSKNFKSDPFARFPARFPSCNKCGVGYPLYRLDKLITSSSNSTERPSGAENRIRIK
jgi:hypothetical protein